ncbi:MAG: biopolymer transporter ExbD [Gemmataceae bacterium]|nr:biopolymer transporter ExbD [Gemmataceae bacterium]
MAGGNAHEEPDLVPLLDLVLQLVMFFMMCANFVMEQVDQTIKLPVAQSAKPSTTGTDSDIVFLTINNKGEMLAVGRNHPLTNDDEVAVYLQGVYDDAKRRAGEAARKAGADPAQAPVETLVIIRADRAAEYSSVYRVMRKCSDIGLRKIQLRATVQLRG